jgi:hypothetical protein
MWKHACRYVGALCCAVAVSGCFTSEEAIYEDEQVLTDPRVEGHYLNLNQDGKAMQSSWWIRSSDSRQFGPRRYEVRVTDGPASITLIGALFRLKSGLYFDLYPLSDSGTKPGEITESQILHSVVFRSEHVIWKVEVTDSEIVYRAPAGRGVFAAFKRSSKVLVTPKRDNSLSVIVLPRSKKEAQEYLEEIGDDPAIYNYQGKLVKQPKA